MLKSIDVNNDILTFPFNDKILGFGEIELIFSICYACRSEKTTEIQTSIKEIRKAREYESMSDLELRESLLITGKKLLSFNILLNDEDKTVIAPCTVFHFNGETLRIRINDEFLHYFSGFVSNYTATDVILLFSILGKHSSILYKILRRYRGMDEPVARIKEKDLIEKLGIEGRPREEIDSIILHSAREVSRYFQDIRLEHETVDSERYVIFKFETASCALNLGKAKPVVKFKSTEPRPNLLGVKEAYPNLENYV